MAWENILWRPDPGNTQLGYVSVSPAAGLLPAAGGGWWSSLTAAGGSLATLWRYAAWGCPEPAVLTYYAALASTGDTVADRAAAKTWLGRSWAEWREEVLEYLRATGEGVDELVYRVDIRVLGHAMLPPTPGRIWGDGGLPVRHATGREMGTHGCTLGIRT